ncbi:TPA: GntR family transcriptional regulator [Pseudomonas putida]|uniref:GntR family transcriptional regulator n=1 Tax=Pseudomonas putida S13.1.2 TaxID=1384061 RepID=A0AAU8S6P6_PSEPU|nr:MULTISPECIES: GntR family transcriptional regulator [Pseudomonas]AJQ51022.1 GntR family transcriptional regulator [Pseudomonas putida S13.1.2]MCS4061887.1 DNA-binding GntR family transcriptional regulator [Pseudomonas putida]MDD1994402.1 GntR family transcriptional regulator [Pseudomonas putida]TCP70758.1 DNA-binding GntR family transcriptional regulator [Pseudomonas putida]HDS0918904.1 GntR family transcriptional regulator [Pseudomonas putida]
MKAPAQPLAADVPQDRKAVLAEALRRRIMSMELAPGAVVDELALCEEFGLSRPPVRELLRQIAAEGYIELEANRAPRVAAMSHESLHSFYVAAPLIYVATTQLAATYASAEEIEVLKAIQAQFRQAIEERDVENRVLYNDAFHLEIGKMAHNDYLMPSLRRLLIDHTRLGKIFYRHPTTDDMQRDLEIACEQHEQMIQAIERRDPQAAGQLVRDHFELSRRRMAEYAAPQGLDVPIQI